MKHLLIVDDNDDNLYLLSALLEGHGYEVERAQNGSEALTKALATLPDMIISDILMPVIDGFTLCKIFKADDRLRQIPFVFYTATYTDPRDEKLALDLGVDAFIVKPAEPEAFLLRIEEILAARQNGKLILPQKQAAGETVILKEYNEALIRKLEQKMLKLEEANKELFKSEARFKRLYESGMLGLFFWNKDGAITDANDKFLEMIGYSREDMALGLINGYAITPREFQAIEDLAVDELRTHGVNKRPLEKEYICKDGSRVSIMIAGALLDVEQFNGIAFVLNNTERKRAEAQLRESEVQYRHLANTGLALIWMAATDKLCHYFNEPWLKFTGRTLDQERGNGWTQGVHPDDLDRCVHIYVTAFDQRESFDMEYRLQHASGEYRWIRDLGSPNYNAEGEFVGYIGHCFDITLQKVAESEREDALNEIRKLNENLEQKINERTDELRKIIAQLEETNRVFVGRELKMMQLKERIAELEKKITEMR